MAKLGSAPERVELLLQTARFVTLATADTVGVPWASTVNYVLLQNQDIRLIWYSMRDAQHSRNIEGRPLISGSIFRMDLSPEQSPVGLDGIQFTGQCGAISDERAADIHAKYYLLNFPEEATRKQWMIPLEQFIGTGPRRFYELVIGKLWLLDLERWLLDREDRRFEVVDLSALSPARQRMDGRA